MDNNTLINEKSLTPSVDEACASLCYYLGWQFEHKHAVAEVETESDVIDA